MGKGPRAGAAGKRTADGPAPGSTGRGGPSSTIGMVAAGAVVAALAVAAAWMLAGGGNPPPSKPAHDRASGKRVNKIETFEEPDPINSTGDALRWLLQPLDPDTWKGSHWDTKPALMRRPAGIYAPLSAGLGSVDGLLQVQRHVERTPLLMHPTSGNSQADCSSVIGGMDNQTASYTGLHHAYLNGATIVCNIVPSYWGPLADLMKGLADATGHEFMANMYLSPRGSQGFTAHTDNKDGLIIQVAGSKRWVIYAGTGFPRPLRHQMRGRPHERPVGSARGKLVFDDVLTAGDVLHLPRGYVHHAVAAEGHALHYTISATKNMEWADFLDGYIAGVVAAAAAAADAPRDASADHTVSGGQDPAVTAATENGIGIDDRIVMAVRAELGAETDRASAGWLRGSLPFHYRAAAHRTALIEALDSALAQARVLAEKRVGRVDGIGKKEIRSGVRRLFEALGTAGPGRDAAIAAVLKKNSVYTNYVRSLVSNGIDVAENHRDYLDDAITDATTVAVTPAAAGAGGGLGLLNPGLSTARLGGKVTLFRDGAAAAAVGGAAGGTAPAIKVLWHTALRDAVAFVEAQPAGGSFTVGEVPGDDAFEKTCLVRMLVDQNVLHRVA